MDIINENTTLRELATLAGETAKAKGWDEKKPEDHLEVSVNLIFSEIGEALEELRKGKKPDDLYYLSKDVQGEHRFPRDEALLKVATGKFKPEGVPAEIADVVIRCAHFLYREVRPETLSTVKLDEVFADGYEAAKLSPEGGLYYLNLDAAKIRRSDFIVPTIGVMVTAGWYCRSYNIDVYTALTVKHLYNTTRPHRHGGKAF